MQRTAPDRSRIPCRSKNPSDNESNPFLLDAISPPLNNIRSEKFSDTLTRRRNCGAGFLEGRNSLLTELMPEIVHEFIEKIVVSKPEKVDGKRHQRVEVYYGTIGLWYAPSPEEKEKLFQEHLAAKRERTA